MKTLRITKAVLDKETKENLKPCQVIERSNERAKDFANYSEDITPKEDKPKKAKKKK